MSLPKIKIKPFYFCVRFKYLTDLLKVHTKVAILVIVALKRVLIMLFNVFLLFDELFDVV